MQNRHDSRPFRFVAGLALVTAVLAGCGVGGGSNAADTAPAVIVPANATPTDDTPTAGAQTTSVKPDTSTPEAPPTSEATLTDTSTVDDTTSENTTSGAPTAGAAGFRGVSLVEELVVFDAPDGAEVATLPATTAFGTPTVVRVLDTEPGWVQVLVPIRPNDLSGWIREADVELEAVDAEIHIDLTSRTLRLTENGETTGEWPVAIGRSDRPTPTGSFFITDKLATGDADSVWGAHAFGVSAYSDVLDDFIGGIGQVGIHGTNDPSSIGNDVSSGCVRLPNEVIDDLINRLPLGTPVHIV
ncbi:L,D-transpeptidase [Ilumatobacter nonamiensis]|uniref:L,D-transpeptidase n=1 Tax=Ilumatobacter nonamiensis TaxID=467093 RepID=UPI00034BEA30|nr:L,D-transpeptidase [Ilumatobacter nonamiensis]